MSRYNIHLDELDEKLEEDIKKYNKTRTFYILFASLLVMFLFRGTLLFYMNFSIPIPTGIDMHPMMTEYEPIQINYPNEKRKVDTFKYRTLLNKNKIIEITPKAKYHIAGLVVAYNYSFFIRNEFFDSAALYDIGIAWDKLADKNFYRKYFEAYSQKNEMTGARILWTRAKTNNIPGFGTDYTKWPYSHTHVIPATRNVMAALLSLNTWDKVEMEGYLINMKYIAKNNLIYTSKSSMSRNDPPAGDEGNGSCEQMYVTKVKIGHLVYE